MALPPAVSRYLFGLESAQRRAICLSVDMDYGLSDWWGDVAVLTDAELQVGDDAREVLPVLHGLSLLEPAQLEYVGLPSGESFHVHVFQEGEAAFVLMLPADVEEAKTVELQQVANEVRLLNARQSKLLHQLELARREVEEKRQAADYASRIKSRFIASMSHEFRTPLTAVLGYTELLLSDANLNSDTNAHSSAIRRAAHHLLSMVDNILDQSRIEEGNVSIRVAPLNVRQVADDISAMLAPLAAEKLLSFGVFVGEGVPETVRTDEVRLRQILVNLVGNAIKFTDSGEIRLEVRWADDMLAIVVSDTGPGIPLAEQQRVFDAFHRVDYKEGKRGTGLGLNITKRLVELLGGTISLESEPGHGCTFTVTVKAVNVNLDSTQERKAVSAFPLPDKTRNERVLIAEDDPDLIELLSLFLTRGGYELVLASNGIEAVEVAMAEQPDLVLMDVNMPLMDGLSAVRNLRAKGFKQPVIALTASLSANDRDQAFSWGCDGYLVKPISMPELLSTIDRQLRERDPS